MKRTKNDSANLPAPRFEASDADQLHLPRSQVAKDELFVGTQLEYHELLKAKLIVKLPDGGDCKLFDRLWRACANMGGYLKGRLGEENVRAIKSGKQWDNLDRKSVRLNATRNAASRSAILDFPNFLLHVLRVYMGTIQGHDSVLSVPLDERQMRKAFEDRLDGIKPAYFLDVLLRTRIRFDQFVIKSEGVADGGEIRWRIEGRDDWSQGERERIVHLESLLQAGNLSQRNKEWLSRLLCDDNVDDASGLISILEEFARNG